jgi:hypothetical protein
MTRHQTLKLQENGFPNDRMNLFFTLFSDDTGIILSHVHFDLLCSSIPVKNELFMVIFHPGPECSDPFPCGRIPGYS